MHDLTQHDRTVILLRSREGEERVPAILQGKALKPFITAEILEKSRPGSVGRLLYEPGDGLRPLA